MPGHKKAAAIKYVIGKDRSPKVVAKGRGFIAEKIVEAARKNGVPIQNDANLANALEALDRARWDWVTEREAWYSFSDDEVAAYAAKIIILHRWRRITAKGKK